MVDLYLRFADEAAALTAFSALGISTAGQALPSVSRWGEYRVDIYVLGGTGAYWSPTGAMLTDPASGTQYPAIAQVPGYHVNVRISGPVAPDFGAGLITPQPQSPSVVWE